VPATSGDGEPIEVGVITEYVYVGQDLRRIALVGASLFGVLLLLWILLVVLGLSGIY